jgi:hypothetical protein
VSDGTASVMCVLPQLMRKVVEVVVLVLVLVVVAAAVVVAVAVCVCVCVCVVRKWSSQSVYKSVAIRSVGCGLNTITLLFTCFKT